MAGTPAGEKYSKIPMEFDKGVDGLSNIADIPEGYLIAATNVDLSRPGIIKKRAGYHLYASELPVRCKSVGVTFNAGTTEYDDVTIQFDTIPQYERVCALSAVAGNDYPNGSYYQPASTQVVFAQVKTYATDPNVNTVTTSTVLEVQIGGAVFYCNPVRVFDNNNFLIPIGIFSATGFSAGDYTIRFCRGISFPKLTDSDITSVVVSGAGPVDITMVMSNVQTLQIVTGMLMRFEAGLSTLNGPLSVAHHGYVTSVDTTTNTVVVRLSTTANFPTVGAKVTDYFTVHYTRGNTFLFKAPSLEFYSYNTPDNVQKYIASCNSMFIDSDCTATVSAATGTYNEVGMLWGTDCAKSYVNLLEAFNNISENDLSLLAGYDGNIFRETQPTTTQYKTFVTSRIAAQVIAVAAGICSILVPDSTEYEIGDVLTLTLTTSTTWSVTTYSFTVTGKPDGTHLTCVESTTLTGNITVAYNNTPLPFTRTSAEILFEKYSYDEDPYIFAGSTLQVSFGEIYATHRVIAVSYKSTATYHKAVIDIAASWNSDSIVYVQNYFDRVGIVEDALTDRYDSLQPEYVPGAVPDFSSVYIDNALYMASSKSGIWKYNGFEAINMRLPPPPTAIMESNENNAGTLLISEDADGTFQGRIYNIVLTYSYFEFINGSLQEIESGVTPFNSMSHRAVPASDQSGNSKVLEIQVPSIPRGIGLPADNILINAYRSRNGSEEGVADGQILLREVSVPNDPDNPFTVVRVGILAASAFDESSKPLYASVSDEVTSDENARNLIAPPLAKVMINYNNRLVCANGYDYPYFKFVANDVFDSDGLFAAECGLIFKPYDAAVQEYRFVTCAVGLETATGSVAIDGVTYHFAQMFLTKVNITSIVYADTSNYFVIPGMNTEVSGVAGNKYLLRYASGKDTKDLYDGFNFNDYVFEFFSIPVTVPPNTDIELKGPKRWTKDFNAGVYPADLPNFILPFELCLSIDKGSATAGLVTLGKSFILTLTGAISINGVAAAVNDMLCIRGLGTSIKMQNDKDTDSKIYDIDTEVFFYITNVAGTVYTLEPYKLGTYNSNTGVVTYEKIDAKIGLSIVNSDDPNIEGLTHGPLEFYGRKSASATAVYTLQVQSVVNDVATLTAAGLGVSPGDIVYVEDTPDPADPGRIPFDGGIEFNRALEVESYANPTLGVYIDPPQAVFENISLSTATLKGKIVADSVVDIQPAYLEINYAAFSLATLGGVAQDQWVFICAPKSKDLTTPMAISGWFKIYQIKDNSDVWQTAISSAGSMKGVRVYLNGSDITKTDLGSLTNIRVLFASDGSASLPTTYTIVPVPVPASRVDDSTGKMFGPLDGFTPLEKISKRFTGAINTVLNSIGFAYWGTPPGIIQNQYPTNGFKFVAHQWLQNQYKYARDTSVSVMDSFEYAIELFGPDGVYELEGDSGKTESISTSTGISDDFRVDRHPGRVWWSPQAGIQPLSFREYEGRQDLPIPSGKEIVGATTFEDYFILFTTDTIWKCRLTDQGSLLIQQMESSVGAISKKNIVKTEAGIIFLHTSGLYYTNGNIITKLKLTNRLFEDYVAQNKSLLQFTAGVHYPDASEVRIGAVISDQIAQPNATIDGEFVLNYNQKGEITSSLNQGWSTNKNVPANIWKKLKQSAYFGSQTGTVYRVRTEQFVSKYRDDSSAIAMTVDSPYKSYDTPNIKFLRELIIHLGAMSDNNCTISMAWNYRTSYDVIDTITVDASALAEIKPGLRYTASEKFISSYRQTVAPNRVEQTSFRFYNSTIDSDGSIYGVFAAVSIRSDKSVRQEKD